MQRWSLASEAYQTKVDEKYKSKIDDLELNLVKERDTVANLMGQVNDLKSELDSHKVIKSNINEANIKLQSELLDMNTQAVQLNEKIAQLTSQMINRGEEHNDIMDIDTHCDENTVTALMSVIRNQMSAVTQELEARIALECKKLNDSVKIELQNALHVIGNSPKRKNNNNNGRANNTPTRNESTDATVRSVSVNPQGLTLNANGFTASANNNFNTNDTDGLLMAPSKTQTKIVKDVYEIYVFGFDCAQTEEKIAEHIVKKSGVKSDVFKVKKLMSRKDPRNNYYSSFKIITINSNAYQAIIDKTWWGDFEVRDFEPTKASKWSSRMKKTNGKSISKPMTNDFDLRRNVLERNNFLNRDRDDRNQLGNGVNETPRRFATPKKHDMPKIHRVFKEIFRNEDHQWNKIKINELSSGIVHHVSTNKHQVSVMGIFATTADNKAHNMGKGTN